MSRGFCRFFVLLFGTTLLLVTGARAADVALTMVKAPGGGQITFGPLSGQMTPEAAMGNAMHRVHVYCGDRPVMGKVAQAQNGDILAAFFTVNGKNQDGKPMAGLAIVSAPKTDTARVAILSDYADKFPTTVNSMFALLKQKMGNTPAPAASNTQSPASGGSSAAAKPKTSGATAAPAASSKPAALNPSKFPDGTGVVFLPAGWSVVRAQMGDVSANGTQGEVLRFGWTVLAIDPTNPQSRALMGRNGPTGNFVAVPYGADPASAYKSAISQLAQKAKKQAPVVNIGKVQDIPLAGGKNYFMYGTIDFNDGHGAQSLVLQMIVSAPQPMGSWQMTWFQLTAPEQAMAAESDVVVNQQIQEGIAETNQFVGQVAQYTDNSNRMTQGMSDFLREQSVVVDTQTGEHARTSNQLSDALVNANPNRYKTLSTGEYIKGIDY